MESNVLAVVQQAVERESAARQQAAELLRQALELLSNGASHAAPSLAYVNPLRPRYIERALEVLRRHKQPMRIAQIAIEMRKEPGMERLKRPALERAIWMEINRKPQPRLKRVKDGHYYFTQAAAIEAKGA